MNCGSTLCFSHMASPYKVLPRILFQLIGRRLSYWSYTIPTDKSRFILTNQDSAFWTNRTTRTWSSHWHEDRPIRDWGGDSCPYKPAPFWLWKPTFPFHQRQERIFPAELKGSGADQCNTTQTTQRRAEQTRSVLCGSRAG